MRRRSSIASETIATAEPARFDPDRVAHALEGADPEFQDITFLHQIFITDGPDGQEPLPVAVREKSERFRRMYPAAEYTLWTKDSLREFISAHFARDVARAFETMVPHAYKTNLARYCVLYVYGGIYGDLSLDHEKQWRIPQVYRFAAFAEHDPRSASRYYVSNTLLWSQPRSRTLALAIDRVVQNCKMRFYGDHPTDVSGAGVLGWACASVNIDAWAGGRVKDQYLGTTEFTHPDGLTTMTFLPIGSDTRPIAGRASRQPGDARYLGGGTNNYVDMWRRREVYR